MRDKPLALIEALVLQWQQLPNSHRPTLAQLFGLISGESYNSEINEQSHAASIAVELHDCLNKYFGSELVHAYILNLPKNMINELTLYDFLHDFMPEELNIGIY